MTRDLTFRLHRHTTPTYASWLARHLVLLRAPGCSQCTHQRHSVEQLVPPRAHQRSSMERPTALGLVLTDGCGDDAPSSCFFFFYLFERSLGVGTTECFYTLHTAYVCSNRNDTSSGQSRDFTIVPPRARPSTLAISGFRSSRARMEIYVCP
jgi:hypothetical protein